jgi:hypothetical protein
MPMFSPLPPCKAKHAPEWRNPERERRSHGRYPARKKHRVLIRHQYLVETLKERHEKEYLQTFTRLLTSEDKIILKQVKVSADPEPTLEEKFNEYANKWERETRYVSSVTEKIMNPNYQAIINMGLASPRLTLSLLLRDMKTTGRTWFTALARISKQNPVKQEDAGNVKKMTKAWLKWGKSEGLL